MSDIITVTTYCKCLGYIYREIVSTLIRVRVRDKHELSSIKLLLSKISFTHHFSTILK